MTDASTAALRRNRHGTAWAICPHCAAVLAPLLPGAIQRCRWCEGVFTIREPQP